MNKSVIALAVAGEQPAHSSRGFSQQSRIMVCGGSVEMSENEPDTTNEEAEKGTAVHELVEGALKLGVNCQDMVGNTFNKFVIDEEMADGGQVYVAYIRQLKVKYPNMVFYFEAKVGLTSLSDDLWGTADFIGIDLTLRLLIVGDYKNGWVIVDVDKTQQVTGYGEIEGNAQTAGYSLAAMDTFDLWGKIDTVINFIVQPNNEHIDGAIRLKTYNMEEMTEWHHAYRASHGRTDIVAGAHCVYCKAAGFCGARILRTFSLIGLSTTVARLTEDQIIAILHEKKAIKRTLDAVTAQALVLARKGKQLTDFKLVKSIVRGYCTNEEKLVELVVADFVHEQFNDQLGVEQWEVDELESKVKAGMYNKPSFKGMTALKKIKGMDKKLINRFFDKPVAGTELVPTYDKRAAIMPDQRPVFVSRFKPIQK